MGVPPVLIHFRLGVSLKSTSIFGVHPSLKRLQPSLPALQTWIAGESSATPRNTICVVIHTIVHIYIYIIITIIIISFIIIIRIIIITIIIIICNILNYYIYTLYIIYIYYIYILHIYYILNIYYI